MPHRFKYIEPVLRSVVGGKSALDMSRLNVRSPKEADAFANGYGFNLQNEQDVKKLWYFHRRALVFLEERLGYPQSLIPEILRDPKQLGDIRQLLLLASSNAPVERELQRWSCAILRVMHVFVHTENDMFSTFSEEIQKQILSPFQDCIFNDGSSGQIFLKRHDENTLDIEPISLKGFEVKPFKTSASTVIKLLAKPDALAMNVYDKLGVRFITHTMYEAYLVVRFLVEEGLISFPHIMPDQSSNNIYPVDLFLEVAEGLENKVSQMTKEEISQEFKKRLLEKSNEVEFLRKENYFSGVEYRFIKFICRKLIKIQIPGYKTGDKGTFSFFFPFEVQIVDEENYQKNMTGPSEHQAYKERQQFAARKRVMPDFEEKKEERK